MGGYTRAVSGQWLGKHVAAATDTHEKEKRCFLLGPCYMLQTRDKVIVNSYVREPVKRGLEPGGREIVIFVAVTRKRLVTD
jgi:hypothetical protein